MPPIPIEDETGQARIRENIRAKTYEATLPAIEKGVEQAVDDVKNNKEGGFWGFLKSMIFKFAEMLGFEKTLAKWFGSPIPEKNEMKAVSAQVSDTVSKALTDKEFTYGNRQEFENGLSQRIFNDLKANAKNTPSFDEKKLAEIARKAAGSVSGQFSELFDANGNAIGSPYLSPVNAMATQKVSDSLNGLSEENKRNLAALAGKKSFGEAEADVLARALGSKMVDLDGRKDSLRGQGGAAFATVAGEVRETLTRNKHYINNAGGMNLTDAGLAAMADQIAVSFVEEQVGVRDMPADFAESMAANKRAAIKEIALGKVDDKLDTLTAESIKSDIDATAKKTATSWKLVPDFMGVPNDWAARNTGFAPTNPEREQVATYINEQVAPVLREDVANAFDSGARALDKDAMLARMEAKIDAGLASGAIPKSFAEHADKIKSTMRNQVNKGLDDKTLGELNTALAEAAGRPAVPSMQGTQLAGLTHDSGFDAPDGTFVGGATTPAGNSRGSTAPAVGG